MGEKEQRFTVTGNAEKRALFSYLEGWLRSLPPAELSAAMADLCTRYRIDLAALSREASMDWEDLAKLAADPLVTIGSATVNYPVLANMMIEQPFSVAQRSGQYDVICTVAGGGLSGQAGAVRHGISKALTYFEPELRSVLKKGGFLTRDSRVVERKKYGKAKARRSFQFSKR